MSLLTGDAIDFIAEVAKTSAVEKTKECLANIKASKLNAFVELFEEEALARAADLDKLPAEKRGRLHGLVVAIKDEVDVAGHVTGYGTRANVTPASVSSHVVQALEAEGAICIGHSRMPEFGAWPITESTFGGITRNPHNPDYTPGGSSGGTAAAVAGGLVPAGIGGDGGGSIRIPSAHCGLVGLKPRRGRVSCWPSPHLWWSLGTTGPLTRSVRDTALIYDIISGNREGDLYTAEPIDPLVDAKLAGPLKFMTVVDAVTPVDPVLKLATVETADKLRQLGHKEVAGPKKLPDPTVPFMPLFFAGIKTEIGLVEKPERLEKRTKQTGKLGFWVTAKVRSWAIKHGEKFGQKVDRLFDQADVILTPTVAARPPKAGSLTGLGPIRAIIASMPFVAFTAIWNVTGHPAISIPVGVGADGLPIGIQLAARDETTLIALAKQLLDEE